MRVPAAIKGAVAIAVAVAAGGATAGAQTATPAAVLTVARGQLSPSAWRITSGLYIATRSNNSVTAPDLLQRRSPQTGGLEASVDLGSTALDVVETGSKLWVATDTYSSKGTFLTSGLEAFDPTTLKLIGDTKLPTGINGNLDLAVAGSNIWVADGPDLVGVTQSTGSIAHLIAASSTAGPKSLFETVTSPQHGQALIDSIAPSNKSPYLQSRDTSTGNVITQSAALPGIAVTHLSAYRSALWVSIVTGNDGYVQRFSLPTLTAATGRTDLTTNTVAVTVYNNTLFVTNTGAGAAANYCAKPTTGGPLATLTHTSTPSELLTSGPYSYFFVPNAITGTSHRIQDAPIPAVCL
jgi:hypothetical protein